MKVCDLVKMLNLTVFCGEEGDNRGLYERFTK